MRVVSLQSRAGPLRSGFPAVGSPRLRARRRDCADMKRRGTQYPSHVQSLVELRNSCFSDAAEEDTVLHVAKLLKRLPHLVRVKGSKLEGIRIDDDGGSRVIYSP